MTKEQLQDLEFIMGRLCDVEAIEKLQAIIRSEKERPSHRFKDLYITDSRFYDVEAVAGSMDCVLSDEDIAKICQTITGFDYSDYNEYIEERINEYVNKQKIA